LYYYFNNRFTIDYNSVTEIIIKIWETMAVGAHKHTICVHDVSHDAHLVFCMLT